MSGGAGACSFVVMTYNVGNGLVPPPRLAALLRRSGADVVGLQEVDQAQAAVLARDTSDVFPFRAVRGTGYSGRGLLSRHPIVDLEWLDLAPGRPDLRAMVDMDGEWITVVVAHPRPPHLSLRGVVFDVATAAQIDRLGELAAAAAPAVLLGDFNMTPRHPGHARLIAAGLVDAHRAVRGRRGATFPLRLGRTQRVNHRLSWLPLLPVARIDYIWHTNDLVTLGVWVGDGAGSDHRPVLARLAPADRTRAADSP